ncbi:hypothetical protein BDZ91DRAFT_759158 [Kalaharituber pfeilii]|nr:hypothetical protein BDZ91DRAFT_759158 [Kalaharituber pfeilii]
MARQAVTEDGNKGLEEKKKTSLAVVYLEKVTKLNRVRLGEKYSSCKSVLYITLYYSVSVGVAGLVRVTLEATPGSRRQRSGRQKLTVQLVYIDFRPSYMTSQLTAEKRNRKHASGRKVRGSWKGVDVMEACIRKVCGSRKGVNVMEASIKKVCGSRKGVNVMEACVRKVCGSRKGVNVIETCIRKATAVYQWTLPSGDQSHL